MRVLMVASNRYRHPLAVMPLGACRVAEAAERAGHRVRLLDLMFLKNPETILGDSLEKFKPEVVGISVRNIDNNDMSRPLAFYPELEKLTRRIRSITQAWVILGGAAVGLMPQEFLRMTGADAAVLGPGEGPFVRLLERLEKRESPAGLENVAWLASGDIRQTPGRLPTANALQVCDIPDFGRWVDRARYRRHMSPVPVQTKRGCPFRCVYCTYAQSEGPHYQLCTPESVVRSLRVMVAAGWQDFEFVDNVFNAPYEHALSLCRQLSRARLGWRLQSVELSPHFLDDTLLEAMESAGFTGMGITAESAAGAVLRGLGKSYGPGHLRQAARAVQAHSLPAFWIFMVGGPGETEDTLEETLDFAGRFIRPRDVAFFNVGIRIYPGTRLERMAREQGVLNARQSVGLQPFFYFAPHLDPERVRRRLALAMDQRLNFLAYDGLSHPLLPWVMRTAYRLGFQPPLWRHTPLLRGLFRGLGFKV